MQILSAVYGSSHGQVDVAGRLREILGSAGRLLLYADNGTFGDPCPGHRKQLSLQYEHAGAKHHVIVDENNLLVAPTTFNTSLGIWYTNNDVEPWVLTNSLQQLSKANSVDILTCPWYSIPGNPFIEKLFPYRVGCHLSICLQILTLLSAARAVKRYDRVFFLEHDVLYPEDYFVMPAIQSSVAVPVAVNDNYIGLSQDGYQLDKDDHEPLHQMVMAHDYALDYFHRLLNQYLRGESACLEPNVSRVRRHTTTPAIHVNHGRHLTSHFATYRPASTTEIPYWGNFSRWWRPT